MPKIISVDPTPNENALKFTIDGRAIASGSATFKKETAANHPIAAAVLAIEGTASVFLLNDFITVQKAPTAHWSDIQSAVHAAIESV